MLLRSLARHLNDTVFRGPDDELGSGEADIQDTGDTGGDVDAGGSDASAEPEGEPERLTVREQIKKSIAETSEPPAEKPKREKGTGRFKSTKPDDGTQPPADPNAAPAPAPAAADDIPAPASLGPEAKAAWANAPKEIKEAFIKREADMQKGVDELKGRYAQIDAALQPHTDALRQMNATPGEAVDRMFLWFKALSGQPTASFPALAQSMGIDWSKLVEATVQSQQLAPGQQQQQQAQPEGEAPPEIPEHLKSYFNQLQQQIVGLTQQFNQVGGRFQTMEEQVQQQNAARTAENLSIWSKDKPHFEAVREDMANLLGKGVIPLKPDGQVDLDKAYETAIYFNPTVRALVLAEQQQANQQVQQETAAAATTAQQVQVEKARRAAVSIPSRQPPGAGNVGAAVKKKPGQRTSVRDSLKQAMAELRDQ